eukprot:GILK01012030.1.p1 GENE.GILK01012030.1~~GILK01012030.1.p1  ORF type:complete len:165 (+),score=24.53 GILK01012030.1:50-496(+)
MSESQGGATIEEHSKDIKMEDSKESSSTKETGASIDQQVTATSVETAEELPSKVDSDAPKTSSSSSHFLEQAHHETAEQYRLRVEFFENALADMDEDQAETLASAWANVHFLGCIYPSAVMSRIRAYVPSGAGEPFAPGKEQKKSNSK